ncbi:non-ribosomal peptide synthetase [Paenibacillus mucilaginosus]|uniref:non-ribosomal peptide synthetase n=1 Tax=Paenibacillus mucilaginosus TaxID=61624 RepID=UPI001EEFA2B2|nr:non-ribosomal peptide synthetase [Paenibacillus mucilaginosus]MCG7215966.1 amino acid adenylation domain-containing protein [Paenibacillus mucilaginosus]WDM24651.1 amino acid adenylation domain-containing protein [Paenibacillus mucilaginosus]
MAKKTEIQDIYPLSPMQKGMLFASLAGEDSSAYLEQAEFILRGPLDLQRVQRSWERLLQRHEALRTLFLHQGIAGITEPRQVVLKARPSEVRFEDLSRLSPADAREAVERFKAADKARGFRLDKDPLMRAAVLRTGPEEHTCIWSHHHIIMDGWCLGTVIGDFFRAYHSEEGGGAASAALPSASPPYSSYIRWLQEQPTEEAGAYWRAYLDGCAQPSYPLGRRSGPSAGIQPHTYAFRLDAALTARLGGLAQSLQVTLNSVVMALWGILLGRYNAADEAVFGTVVSGRPAGLPGVERMVGLFINTVPLRIRTRGLSFAELAREVQRSSLSSEPYHHYPLYEIQKESEAGQELISHVIGFENYPAGEELEPQMEASGLKVEAFRVDERTHYDFDAAVITGRELGFRLNYNALRYDPERVRRIEGHLRRAAEAVTADPNMPAHTLDIVTDEEKASLLAPLLAVDSASDGVTAHGWFAEQAARTPERKAVVCGEASLSYMELETAANRLADTLRGSHGAGPGKLVGVLAGPSVHRVTAVLAVLKSGAAFVPIDPGLPFERICRMTEHARLSVIVSQEEHTALLQELLRECPELQAGLCLDSQQELEAGAEPAADGGPAARGAKLTPAEAGDSASQPELRDHRGAGEAHAALTAGPRDLAYVIYTSGTTGEPKGVMVEHRSLVNLAQWHIRHFALTAEDRGLLYAGFGFDAAVWELFPPLLAGSSLYPLPERLRLDLAGMRQFMEEQGITQAFLPTAIAEPFLEEPAPRQLRLLLTGGDRLKRVRPVPYALHNNYGPTENTVVAASCRVEAGDGPIPIGRPIDGVRAYVLDADGRLLPAGAPGELCIAGAGLARGYWRDPEQTALRFVPDPFVPGGTMYRSGDRVRWRSDGTLEFLGRTDAQLKIRGHRIEPGEIEARLLLLPAVREAAVVAKEEGAGSPELWAYYSCSGEAPGPGELKRHLAAALPGSMVPSRFVRLLRLPLTPNGKVDRKALALRQDDVPQDTAFAPPRTEMEAKLAALWQEVLGGPAAGIHDSFFERGGDSIKAIQLAARLHKERLRLDVRDLFRYPVLAELAEAITPLDGSPGQSPPQKPASIEQHLSKEEFATWLSELRGVHPGAGIAALYPLTPLQEGMLFHAEYHPQNEAYFEQLRLSLQGPLDLERFRLGASRLAGRHDILRTVFRRTRAGRPLQAVLDGWDVPVRYEDLRELPREEQGRMADILCQEDRRLGFDLAHSPALRFTVLHTGEQTWEVVWSYHHILLDGWCLGILMREFMQLYTTPERALPPAVPYSDFIRWLEERNRDEAARYWTGVLEGCDGPTPVPSLKEGRAKEAGGVYRHRLHEFTPDPVLTERLKTAAATCRTTLNHVIQAAWAILLAKYNHTKDVIFGTVVSGRPAGLPGVEAMVGLFINTIPVRVRFDEVRTLPQLLQRMTRSALDAAAYDWFPLAGMNGGTGASLVSHLCVFENYPLSSGLSGMDRGGVTAVGAELFEQTSYDFNLIVLPHEGLRFKLSYNTEVYDAEEMWRIEGHLLRLLEHMAADHEAELGQLEILPPAEFEEAVVSLNRTAAAYPDGETLISLFETQAQQGPERTALLHGQTSVTYGRLNAQGDAAAGALIEAGVMPGDRVALIASRGLPMISGLLGILKAGAAYVPIDPEYPAKRQAHLARHAEARAILTDMPLPFEPDSTVTVIRLDGVSGDREGERAAALRRSPSCAPDDLAYIIYTSGSTGEPKGVRIRHRSAVNLIHWVNSTYRVGPEDRLLWVTSLSFDLSVYDLFGMLAAGGSVVIAEKEEVQDPRRLWRLMTEQGITFWDSVPTTMHYLVQSLEEAGGAAPYSLLRLVFLSGDWIPVSLRRRLRAFFPEARTIGLGGATEAAVWSNCHEIGESDEKLRSIPYGRPIANNRYYVLDGFGRPAPPGVPGELYIGGIGVADGYMNDGERTAAAFVPDPFLGAAGGIGTRMYRTGDLGRLRPDGTLEFLGRKDGQAKVRGYRIEPGEIEQALLQLEAVREAVVVTRRAEAGHVQLCAYYTAERAVAASEAKRHLARTLPAYMVPDLLMQLESLPLSANGKIDRRALPAPQPAADGFTEPKTTSETRLAAIWRDLLKVERIDVRADFFQIGGHSLLAAALSARIAERFGVEVPLHLIFRLRTLEELAGGLDALQQLQGGAEESVTRLIGEGEGEAPKVFCFPPVAGYGFEYRALAEKLPAYAWYAFDFLPEAEEDEHRAAAYAARIRRLQPEGPYVLLGYSAGGCLAYETAAALEAEGAKVAGLLILDAERRTRLDPVPDAELFRDTEEQLTAAEERYGGLLSVPSVRREAQARMYAYRRYLHRTVNGAALQAPVHLLLAEGSEVLPSWSGGEAGPLTVYQGSGTHMEMLEDPALTSNARLLGGILEAAISSVLI